MEDLKHQSLPAESFSWSCNACSQVLQSSSEFISHGETFHPENQYSTCIMCDSVIVSEKDLNDNETDEGTPPSVSDFELCTIDHKALRDICNMDSTSAFAESADREGFKETTQDDSVNQTNKNTAELTVCSACYDVLPVLRNPSNEQKCEGEAEILGVLPPWGSTESSRIENKDTDTDNHCHRGETADISQSEEHSADLVAEIRDSIHSPSVKTFGKFPVQSYECKYECDQCDKTFTEMRKLREHLQTHNEIRLLQCGLCDKAFQRKSHLVEHLRIHTGEKPFKCDQCDRAFTHKGNLTQHLRTHSGEKPFQCDHCDRAFTQKGDLTQHLRTHSGEKPFQCDQCDKAFARKSNLIQHLRTHSGEKPFHCDQCDKTFAQKHCLTSHLRTHTGEKPFQCDQCDKSFAWNHDLTRHLRTHSREKPFQCDQCDKAFAWKHYLTSHLRTHSGEKPYVCDQCDKSFTRKRTLTDHLRSHSGEKPFQCAVCHKVFADKSNLAKHLRTHSVETGST